ncbi:hypothetical protein HHK36_011498 [Tetracentron sinense]|uniref:Uncharacterized protein n=1 Tax=Tetracentron sinense TaxID=13715 RepID=A0A835DHC2_TETSI|nr:hypothetical protein HHK36_011498 [Tetracentron sinense]
MATAATGSYEGGAGGKFRKRPFRKAATPYARPATALRNPIEAGRSRWISKLVDPASRIITRSAQMFFSSFFQKKLPAPQAVSEATEANLESKDEFTETVPIIPSGTNKRVSNEGDNPSNSFNTNGFTELEEILKQKTFTRQVFLRIAEIDRLTELLRSRTVDVPVGNGKKMSEPSTPQPLAAHDRQEDLANISKQENGMDIQRLLGVISTPAVSSSVLEEDVASPTELAKAYMGSRPSKVSPSMLGFRSQALRGDVALRSNLPLPPMSPGMSLAPRSSIRIPGVTRVSEIGGLTPRPRGRSAIYSMACTPYSRSRPSAAFKGVGSTIGGYAGPSTSSQLTWEDNTLSGGKQISKRRSSVLDNDVGSVGPIRRIRQKINLISPSKNLGAVPGSPLSPSGTGIGSDAAQRSLSSLKPLLLDEPRRNTSNMLAENGDNDIPTTSFAAVPSQSSDMAQKILQGLDKLVPSPKEKSSELKLATAREKSPTKLTLSMLHGQALRSVENVDSSKFLYNSQGNGNLVGLDGIRVPGGRDSTSQKQDKVEENGPTKIVVPRDGLAPGVNGVGTTILIKDPTPSVKEADSSISNFDANPPQKKRAFRMSAHEDYLELDDDVYSNGAASTAMATGKEKLDTFVVESKVIATESVTVEKPSASSSLIKPPASFILNKDADMGASDGTMVAQKNNGFTFPVAPASSPIIQPATFVPQSSSLFDKAIPPKEPTAAPLFNFNSKSVDKDPPVTFSSMSSGFGESSDLNSGVQSDTKLETLSSIATMAATATNTLLKPAEAADKGDNANTQRAAHLFSKPETTISSDASISTTPSIFSFGASTNNSTVNNGSLSASPSIFSVVAPVPVSGSSTNQSFSTSPSFTAISSSRSTSDAAPTFPSTPIFQFGSSTSSSLSVSNAVSPASTTSGVEPKDLESKTKQASPFGNKAGSLFGVAASASTGSSTFGFSATATTSTMNSSSVANNQSQSSTFGAGTGSLFGAQAAPAGTGVAPFTPSMPSQFGSSASSPTFGLSGASAFTSSSSLFGSSTKMFGSSSGFGLSSSATSTGANSISSGSSTTSLFGSSSLPATSSIFGSTFGSSSSAPGFMFGGSSTAVATNGSAPMTFGSSIGASSGFMFSSTSATATSSSASLSPSQSVFGNPNAVPTFGSASPSNDQMNMEDSMAEDTAQAPMPAVSSFGQPAASPPSNFMFGSPAPSGVLPFQFGGSQQNLATPQNPSPFQATGNLEFNAGGSFSLGTGGTDKSGRKFVKARRDKARKR